MSRIIRSLAFCALAAAGIIALSACGLTSSSSGGTGRVNVLVTDAPSDDWQQVTVQLKSIALRNQADQSWTNVWTGDPNAPTTLNLVDLSGVTAVLSTATGIPAATYDRLKLVINNDPTTMTLVDDAGNTISPANITVVDPSGAGEIKVDIKPAMTVTDGTTANLQVDFDLAHPLSIFVLNGKVVINLQIRHKAVPRNLKDLQFARTLGNVTAADTSGKASFTLKTLEGAEVLYGVNANTIYVDVDANAAGNFDGVAALVGSTDKGALVASNMNSDGTFYARRVWYGALTKLPQFTPEGLVRRVGDNWIKVLNKTTQTQPTAYGRSYCGWDSDLIYVNNDTIWTFHDTIPMGTGTAILQNIRRGFRVSVEYVDATATPKVAKSINVQSAHDEGSIRSVTLPTETTSGSISFGGGDYCRGWMSTPPPDGGLYYSHEWTLSAIPEHAFSWWFFGLPSSASTNVQDLSDTVNQAKTTGFRVFARAELYWDQTNSRWVVEDLVLAPEKVREPTRITTGYTVASGSMAIATFDWDNETLPMVMTVYLDNSGDLQTVVGLYSWDSSNRVLTTTFPVLPGQWESVLTPSLWAVKVWVRAAKTNDGTLAWHAYTVIGYRVY
jgi:hypothetical protein